MQAPSNNCSAPPLWPIQEVCTGRVPACNALGGCDCPAPWSQVGDLTFNQPSCNIHLTTVVVEWALLAAGHLVFLLRYSLPTLYRRVHFVRQPATNKQQQEFSKQQTLLLQAISLFLANCCMATTGILRAVYPLNAIGSDVLVSVIWGLGCIFLYSAIVFSVYIFLLVNQVQHKMRRGAARTTLSFSQIDALHRLKFPIMLGIWLVTFFACCCNFLYLLDVSVYSKYSLGVFAYLGTLSLVGVVGIFVLPMTIKHLIIDVDEALAREPNELSKVQLLHVRNRLNMLRQSTLLLGLANSM